MSNMVVRTNVMSLNSHRALGMVSTQQRNASARLSSGFRINSAADDAAGLAISEKMRGQIRGLNQASRNAQDGISLIQTAEGAMQTVNEMVTRIRELVIQAANDTNAHYTGVMDAATWSQSDRIQIQREIDQLFDEIDAVSERAQFNTRNLIDGSLAGSTGGIQLDGAGQLTAATAVNTLRTAFNNARATYINNAADLDMGLDGLTAGEVANIRNSMNSILDNLENTVLRATSAAQVDAAMAAAETALSDLRDAVEAEFLPRLDNHDDWDDLLDAIFDNDFGDTMGTLETAIETFRDIANLTFTDEDGATQNTGTIFDRLTDGSGALWFHIGANSGQGIFLSIEDIGVDNLNTVATSAAEVGFNINDLRVVANGASVLDHGNYAELNGRGVMRASGEEINRFVTALDAALGHVTGQRAMLGAMQNRLEFTIENLDISSENLSASESRIRDADMALEMMRLTQANILQQAATSMLAQANQAPQSVLQLLG